jgi:hypothetical protein
VPTPNTPAGMRSLGALSLVSALLFAGCMGDEDSAMTRTTQETATTPQAELTLFFLRDGKVAPVSRGVPGGPNLMATALEELFEGPEPDDDGLETAIPTEMTSISITAEGNNVASLGVSKPLSQAARAQIVYTLTQFPTVKRVSINEARPVGRKSFEDQTPAILVESPLPGETVKPDFTVTGTANTFEATFNYELWASGTVLAKDFVTATSGSGTRGTFAFKVSYAVDEPTAGNLVVFELSAEDGTRIHQQQIPLRLE